MAQARDFGMQGFRGGEKSRGTNNGWTFVTELATASSIISRARCWLRS